ncbi:hypothetical protein Tco_0609725, partial [Tanacetum coccineum]
VVEPPHPLVLNRPAKLDLSNSGLDEFKEPEFQGYGPKINNIDSSKVCDVFGDHSDDNKESEEEIKVRQKLAFDTFEKIKFVKA